MLHLIGTYISLAQVSDSNLAKWISLINPTFHFGFWSLVRIFLPTLVVMEKLSY